MFDSGHGNCTVGALNPLTEECGPRLPSACKDPQIYREFISNQNNFNHCHNWLCWKNDHLAIGLRELLGAVQMTSKADIIIRIAEGQFVIST